MTTRWDLPASGAGPKVDRPAASGDCWRRIGVAGDRSCPELSTFIHCRNCPVFADAARSFFDRPAPEGYLAEWTRWLAETDCLGPGEEAEGSPVKDQGEIQDQREWVSVLIFRLGGEWLAWPTGAIVAVTRPRPVHRVPHRFHRVFTGLVNLHGQAQLCVSLHGLLGVDVPASSPRLVVVRDRERAETWAFGADEVLGVHRVPRSQWRSV